MRQPSRRHRSAPNVALQLTGRSTSDSAALGAVSPRPPSRTHSPQLNLGVRRVFDSQARLSLAAVSNSKDLLLMSEHEDADSGSALTNIVDAAADLVSGATLPAPIRKNLFKALGQLCTAAVDVPAAYLEGVAAEKRAEAQARVRLITAGAEQLATDLAIAPEYAAAASRKVGQRIIREQINIDKIASAAARQVVAESSTDTAPSSAEGAPAPSEPSTIDDDWLNVFEREAAQKSSTEMQELFGRILAGEIRKPATFSIKTVRLLGHLDARAAGYFQKLCSLSVSLRTPDTILDARVAALGGNAAANALASYGLSFGVLNALQEYGLIIPDYNSWFDYRLGVVRDGVIRLPIAFQQGDWGLLPLHLPQPDAELQLRGVRLSVSGLELLPIVDIQPQPEYTEALQTYFRSRGYEFRPVTLRASA